jgi:general secretion pathway protein C
LRGHARGIGFALANRTMKKHPFVVTASVLGIVLGFAAGVLVTGRPEVEHYTVERTVLSRLNQAGGDVRIVPTFHNGVAKGFKVFSLQPGSVVEQLGLKNGDVVTRLGGVELNDPERVLEAYASLATASKLELEVERGGATKHLHYLIH